MSDFMPPKQSAFPGTLTGSRPTDPIGTPGKRTLVDGIGASPVGPAIPGKRTLVSHHQPPSAFRTPSDEGAMDWTKGVQWTMPPEPYVPRDLDPGYSCPLPENAVPERSGSSHGLVQDYRPAEPAIILTEPRRVARQRQWTAYRAVGLAVMDQQQDVSAALTSFRHAQANPVLRSLGFVVPNHFQGDLVALASAQKLPQRGGIAMEELFSGIQMKMTAQDDAAIDTVAQGGADREFNQAMRSDSELRAALSSIKSAALGVKMSGEHLRKAQLAIEHAAAEREVASAEAEIKELTETSEKVKGVFEFIDHAPERLIDLAKTAIDNVSHFGSICSLIYSTFPSRAMTEASARLEAARAEVAQTASEMLARDFAEALDGNLKSMQDLTTAKEHFDSAMLDRRTAYDDAGKAVGRITGNPKLAAVVSAIPIVETLVSVALVLRDKTRSLRPAYGEEAGRGYGIAVRHHVPQAAQLPIAIGELEWCEDYFAKLHGYWASRLVVLQEKQQRMAGQRPGDKP